MKQILTLALAVLMIFSLSACGGAPGESDTQVSGGMPETVPPESEMNGEGDETTMETKPAVYMTSEITPEGLMAVYQALNWAPSGRVAVKLSTGEPPASNYLRPDLIQDLVQSVNGTIVECNTAYGGSRNGLHTLEHAEAIGLGSRTYELVRIGE